jgi:putative transposase
MLDEDVAVVSPASVYRVLSAAGLLDRWNQKPSKKGTGFEQPLLAHQHWHLDVAYLNIASTFYYLCSIPDGFSRAVVALGNPRSHARGRRQNHLAARPRTPSRSQTPHHFRQWTSVLARDFKEFVRLAGMTHVRTSPYDPQSNGKIERWHRTIKSDAIRRSSPSSVDDARKVVADFVDHYNNRRLHSAIGFITPADTLRGRRDEIWAARDRKLEAAREARRLR